MRKAFNPISHALEQFIAALVIMIHMSAAIKLHNSNHPKVRFPADYKVHVFCIEASADETLPMQISYPGCVGDQRVE